MTAATNRKNRRATTRSRRRAGRKTTQIGASATTTWGYDSSDRLQYLRSGSLTRFTYSYDNNSNLKTVEDLIGSRSTYLYDAKNRLTQDATSGTNAHTYDYSYDSRDNRTYSGEEGQWQFAYDAANRLVTAVNAGEDPEPVRTFTCDDNGNTTRIEDSIAGTTTMAYDCENRLSALQTASSLATYLYDGDGRKRVEIGASGRTTLVWDGWDYFQSYSGSKPLNYYTVDGLILAQRFDEEYAEYLPDFLGTVAAYADESGSALAEARYKPYGLPLWSDGPVEDFAFGWVGQWGYRRAVDGIYVRRREYLAALSSWTTQDPLWPNQPPYAYVPSPVDLADPLGLCDGWYYEWPNCPYLDRPPSDSGRYRHQCEGDPCGWALKQGLDNGDRGFVICCRGKAYPCAKPWDVDDSITKCILEHERDHISRSSFCKDDRNSGCRAQGVKNRDLGGGYFDIGTERDECLAYTKELSCLLKVALQRGCYPVKRGSKDWLLRCGYLVNEIESVCESGRVYCVGLSIGTQLRTTCESSGH